MVLSVFLTLFLCLLSGSALADAPIFAQISHTGDTISSLTLSDKNKLEIRVEEPDSTGRQKIDVIFDGTISSHDSTLICAGKVVVGATDPKRKFRFKTDLQGEHTKIELTLIDVFGKAEKETLDVWFPQFDRYAYFNGKKPAFLITLGYKSISYQETELPQLSESAVTVGLSYQKPLRARLGIEASAYLDAVTLSQNQPGESVRFFGANGDLSYLLAGRPGRIAFYAKMGFYYETTTTSGLAFGYQNLLGPELYPALSWSLSPKNSIDLFFKYSPASSVISFSSHELASGLSWDHSLGLGRSISGCFNYIDDEVTLGDGIFHASAKSALFSVGYGF